MVSPASLAISLTVDLWNPLAVKTLIAPSMICFLLRSMSSSFFIFVLTALFSMSLFDTLPVRQPHVFIRVSVHSISVPRAMAWNGMGYWKESHLYWNTIMRVKTIVSVCSTFVSPNFFGPFTACLPPGVPSNTAFFLTMESQVQ